MRPTAFPATVVLVLLAGCNAGEQDMPVPPDAAEEVASEDAPDIASLFSCGEAPPDLVIGDLNIGYFEPSGVSMAGLSITSLGPDITIIGFSMPAEPVDPPVAEKQEQDFLENDGGYNTTIVAASVGAGPEVADVIVDFPNDCNGTVRIEADGLPTHATAVVATAAPRVYRVPAQPASPGAARDLEPDRLDGILFNGVPLRMRMYCGEDCTAFINPMHGDHGLDAHNGHTQDGLYHYHGNPGVLYEDSGLSGATIIGVAADGHPIFGPWIDENGIKREVTSSYALRSGARPDADGGGFYDGSRVHDYEYIHGLGDLDECNGARFGVIYGYFVTDDFPYVMNCLRGDPDPSFTLAP